MDDLNDHHKSHLRTAFAHVDELLSEALRDLDKEQAGSPFYRLIPDADPIQQKVMADYVIRVRSLMRNLLAQYNIALPAPSIRSTWAASTVLSAAVIAFLECEPSRMRGYGPLAKERADELHGMIAQLIDLLRKMEAYLAQGSTRDLRLRLERLKKKQPITNLLQELERVITAHGMVEFRPTLESLVQRAESPALEIGVFGRVKTGKSSFLNYILQTEVLTVGVTPITAVPTHIRYGIQPLGKIWFAEEPMLSIELDRLSEFATEQHNPANSKHVTRIEVEIPSQILERGMVFVDTPGIGSLALSGAAETLAYLPRCDLGIVLVDCGSALNSEDLALVDLLQRAGADVMLLLSKADILKPEDRQTTADYVRALLQSNIGLEVPVYAISTQGTRAELCDHWMTEIFLPLMQGHQHLVEQALQRKINGLLEAVQTNLQRRLTVPSEPDMPTKKVDWAGINNQLINTLVELDTAQKDRIDTSSLATELTERVIDDVSQSVVVSQDSLKRTGDVNECLTETLSRNSADLATKIGSNLIRIRASVFNTLKLVTAAAELPAMDDADVPKPNNMPLMDCQNAVSATIRPNARWRMLGEGFLRRNVQKQLRETCSTEISNVFIRYAQQLEKWRQSQLAELQQYYATKSDFILAQKHTEENSEDQSPIDHTALENDLKILGQLSG